MPDFSPILPPRGDAPPGPPPLVLLAQDEWSARSLESVLAAAGMATVRARTARGALEQARALEPDAVIVGAGLPDAAAGVLCSRLRADDALGPCTPLVVAATSTPTRAERLGALRGGAWEVLAGPVDAEELLARLETLIRSSREAGRLRRCGLLDPQTGAYNVSGLLRRLEEIGAEARRRHEAVGCLVLSVEGEAGAPGDPGALLRAALPRMERLVRRSDALGRTGAGEVAVVAAGAGPAATLALARRYAAALQEPGARVRIGCYAADDLESGALEPSDLLIGAGMALRRSQRGAAGEAVAYFSPATLPG